jgi:DNA end-binding protein Ku
VKLAVQIIDSLASDWNPKRYHDTYTEELRDLIERKAKGEEITVDTAEEEPTGKVVDLMAALQASLEGKPRRRGPQKKAAATKAKTAPRRKSA